MKIDGFSVKKDQMWLSSFNATKTGRMAFVKNKEFRGVFDKEEDAKQACIFYNADEVINEYSGLIVYPPADDLCAFCCCSLDYGYMLHKGAKFCSESCYEEANDV